MKDEDKIEIMKVKVQEMTLAAHRLHNKIEEYKTCADGLFTAEELKSCEETIHSDEDLNDLFVTSVKDIMVKINGKF